MALKDLLVPTVDVQITGGSFAVRGLSSDDIQKLLIAHGDEFRAVWDEFLADETDLSQLKLAEIKPYIAKIIRKIPDAMIDLVGLAADADDDDMAVLRRLPVGVQVEAAGAVLSVTLNADGDWAKMMETGMKLLGGVNGGFAELMKAKIASQ